MIGKTNASVGADIKDVLNFPFDLSQWWGASSISSVKFKTTLCKYNTNFDAYLPSIIGSFKLKDHASFWENQNYTGYSVSTSPSTGSVIMSLFNPIVGKVDIPNGKYILNAVFVEDSLIQDNAPIIDLPITRNNTLLVEKTNEGFTSDTYSTFLCASQTAGPGRMYILGVYDY